MTAPTLPVEPIPHIRDVIDVRTEGDRRVVHLATGYDVFGNAHGGHVLAVAAAAVLDATGAPDLFSITGHFVSKPTLGADVTFSVAEVGGSRRFTSVHATGEQEDGTILTLTALVGSREGLAGPTWTDRTPWRPDEDHLGPPADADGMPFQPPNVARAYRMRMHPSDVAFAAGRTRDDARIRAWLPTAEPDVLDALVACDVTPPAGWNALGFSGWVPTIELTAHVRTAPAPGPLTVVAESHHAADGLIDEEAVVHDADGRLVVQARQLARWITPG